MSLAVNTSSIPKRDTNFKDQSYKRDGEESAPTCKSTVEQTNACEVIIEERSCKSVTKEMEGKTFPKILEVYSLNSQTQAKGETEDRKRKYAQDVSPSGKEDTLKDETPDGGPPAQCSFKKPCVDNFIDLTVDEEEETIAFSSDDINMNETDYRSELKQLKENMNDNEMEWKSTKCNKGKRKGVFFHGKKGEMNQPIQQKQRDISKNPTAAGNDMSTTTTKRNRCNSDGNQHRHQNGNDHEENKYTGERKETLHDQNNNKKVTKKHEQREQNGMCDDLNNSDSYSLNRSYRENKITDLKARLAKQEEELAKLKILKECKTAAKNRPPTQFIQVIAKKSERKENSRLELDDQLPYLHTPETVSLDDICQHVIKSFDLFNARKDKRMGKEGYNSRQAKEKNSIMNQATDKGGDKKQDEFLFHVGLRRKSRLN